MMAYYVKALDAGTWPDFAKLAEAHNGIWGAAGAWPSTPRAKAGACLPT